MSVLGYSQTGVLFAFSVTSCNFLLIERKPEEQ